MIEKGLLLMVAIYMVIMAVIDGKKKEIPVLPGVLCLICVVFVRMINHEFWWGCLFGMLEGGGLYVLSRVTKGAIGEGDSLVYTLTGALFGFEKNVELLVYSLFLCSFVSIVLLMCRRIHRKDKIAFLPFTAVAYGLVVML